MAVNLTEHKLMAAVRTYGRRLFSFIRGRVRSDADAEDILQEVWMQLSSVVDLDQIESMSGWLHQVARNKITDGYRKKRPIALADLSNDREDSDADQLEALSAMVWLQAPEPEEEYFRELFWAELMNALEELPEKQRSVFVKNELENMTLRQIADQTGENLKTIISRKRYAVMHLRQRLEDLYEELNDAL